MIIGRRSFLAGLLSSAAVPALAESRGLPYMTATPSLAACNVLDMGSTVAGRQSQWVIGWGEDSIFGVYPGPLVFDDEDDA